MPEYPGWGLDLRHTARRGTVTFLGDFHSYSCCSAILSVREAAMMMVMDLLTDKPDWHVKVFDDDIAEKWRQEALGWSDHALSSRFAPSGSCPPGILDRESVDFVSSPQRVPSLSLHTGMPSRPAYQSSSSSLNCGIKPSTFGSRGSPPRWTRPSPSLSQTPSCLRCYRPRCAKPLRGCRRTARLGRTGIPGRTKRCWTSSIRPCTRWSTAARSFSRRSCRGGRRRR